MIILKRLIDSNMNNLRKNNELAESGQVLFRQVIMTAHFFQSADRAFEWILQAATPVKLVG